MQINKKVFFSVFSSASQEIAMLPYLYRKYFYRGTSTYGALL